VNAKPPTIPASGTDPHLAFSSELDAARSDLEALVDAACSSIDLEAQRERIRVRLAAPGSRVLAFPARPAVASTRPRPAMRWLAGSAAAGLLVGVIAGHYVAPPLGVLADRDGLRPDRTASQRWTSARAAGARHTDHSQDESFLVEMETVLNDRRVAELRALDHLTPVIVLDRSR
jgi:hypothetical protein